jgi:hypothetical protein
VKWKKKGEKDKETRTRGKKFEAKQAAQAAKKGKKS